VQSRIRLPATEPQRAGKRTGTFMYSGTQPLLNARDRPMPAATRPAAVATAGTDQASSNIASEAVVAVSARSHLETPQHKRKGTDGFRSGSLPDCSRVAGRREQPCGAQQAVRSPSTTAVTES